ncbi:YPL264C [Symbiodinium necroappetens]|uniref:YPL264C protein n=1 Tax=Symbiodinium necroappetens TaxID=1628268 RepID=A0A812IYA5_9DINO|nr:YPL264C [Symbiodinium necroappetens]
MAAAVAVPIAARFYTPPAISSNGQMKLVPRPLVATNWQAVPSSVGGVLQRQAVVQAPEAPVQWRQLQTTASSATSKVLVVKEPGDAARSPTGSVQEARSGRCPEPSPERQEGSPESQLEASSSKAKLDYVVAGVANLRRSLERQLDHPRGERLDLLLEEAKKLSADLQPFVSLSNEFKSKWDSQKAAILSQKKTEIDAHLQREDDIAQAEFAKTAEVELRALATAEEQRGGTARSQELEAILRQAVETWRAEVHGASLVSKTDVEKAVRTCLARVVAWTSTQEQRMVATWKETARQLVLEVHKADANSFQALEDTLSARRAIVDDLLTRQRRELTNAYRQMQDNLTHKTREMLQSDREVQRKRDSKADRRLILKEAQQAARSRVEVAKAESLKALDAHTQLCCSKVDRWASLFLLKKSLLQEVIGEIGPMLAANLDDELRTTVAQIRQRQNQRVGDAEDPPQRGVGSEELEDGEGPAASPEESAELEAMRRSRMTHELKDLKDEVEAMLAASRDRKSWKRDIDEAAAKGLILLQDAKAALEVQSQIFQKADGSQADDRWLKETVTGLSNCTQSFHADLVPKFEDVSNLKLMCIKKRHNYLGQPVQKLEQSLLDAEREILKSITRLAAEVEALSEIGRLAMHQAAALAPVASSWRKAATAALSIVQRLWQLAKTGPEEQKSFFTRLLAVLDRSPLAADVLARGFRKRGGEGRSSGGGPTTLNFSTSSSSKVQARPKAPATRDRGSTASQVSSRNSPRGQGPGSRRTSSTTSACVSPRRDKAQAKAKEAPKPCFSPAWPADIFAREEASPCAHSPRGDGRGRDAWNRAESPHDCIASARSRSPEMDGVMRRSGAGRSSGGGPSSICLGDTPSKTPALRIPQRAFSDGPGLQPRESREPREREPGKEKERSWRRQSDLSVKSLSTYCPEDTPCVAVSATDAGEDRGLAYDDLFAENRLLRAENAQLRSELEKYQAWYEQLTASYYNGNGYLKK